MPIDMERQMPIEYMLLKDMPCKVTKCPVCGAAPLEPFMRGQVLRRRKEFWLFGCWDYSALVCGKCKSIAGWESPENYWELPENK